MTVTQMAPSGAPPDPHPTAFRFRVTLIHGEAPPEGLVPAPFEWEDALDTPPPRPVPPGERQYCVPAEDVTDPDVRIESALILRVHRADAQTSLEMEDRVAVSERTFAGAIAAESETVGAAVAAAEARSAATTEEREAQAERWEENGGATAVAGRAVAAGSRTRHRVVRGALGAVRAVTTGVVRAPDRFRDRWKDAGALLATPEGRTRFRYGLTHPQELHARQKAATLFVSLLVLTTALAFLHFAVTLVTPQFAMPWRTEILLFAYGVVTSLGLPLPIEPLLIPAAASVGTLPVLGTATLAKVIAGYLVFFLGDEINDKMRERAETSPRFAKWLGRSERFARRFGVFAMALFIAMPGLPDFIALYVFGSLGMRLSRYLIGIALGGVVLYGSVLYGAASLLGVG